MALHGILFFDERAGAFWTHKLNTEAAQVMGAGARRLLQELRLEEQQENEDEEEGRPSE